MVRKISISPEESDLTLPTGDDDREVKENDPLSSNYPTWSSRMKCLQAYICVLMSFIGTLEHCKTIGLYGTAAFIAYLVYAVAIGVPIVLVEVLLGRYVMGNVVKAWSMCPIAKGILACLFVTTAYTIYCNNICNAYLFKYLFSFYLGYIPWDKCRNPWAKDNCYVFGRSTSAFMKCVYRYSEPYCKNMTWETSGTQYWKYVAGNRNSTREVCLTALFLAVSIALVVLFNLKGHRSCEKAFFLLVCLPFMIALVLAFAAYISPGAVNGLKQFLRFNSIYELRMWLAVFEDFLLSTGLGTLALSFVSSHGKFKDNIFIDVFVVTFTSIFSSLLTALPILCVIAVSNRDYIGVNHHGHFIDSESGNLHIFILLSDSLLNFHRPNVIWCFLFFLEMILITLANQTIMTLSFCEAIWAVFLEKNKLLLNSIIVGIISFALGIPYLFIEFNFEFPIQTSVITVILLYAVTWQFFYGFRRFDDDYHFMLGYPPSLFFLRLFWMGIIPMLSAILALKMYFRIPDKPLPYMVFIYAAIPVVLYLFVVLVQVIRAGKHGADPNWGPDNSILKMSRIIFNTQAITKEFMYRQELHRKPLLKPPDFTQQNIVQLN